MDLQSYLSARKIEPPEFARTIEVSAASVYRYMARNRTPRPEVMERIAKATGGAVQPNDFFATAANAAENAIRDTPDAA